ncbi:hypothetical protein HDU96_009445 [Phlyctochytrium bullatum]|nr:hypothetical protein HDU96_009445 [Phlyctochytrium bullatum]
MFYSSNSAIASFDYRFLHINHLLNAQQNDDELNEALLNYMDFLCDGPSMAERWAYVKANPILEKHVLLPEEPPIYPPPVSRLPIYLQRADEWEIEFGSEIDDDNTHLTDFTDDEYLDDDFSECESCVSDFYDPCTATHPPSDAWYPPESATLGHCGYAMECSEAAPSCETLAQ